LGIHSRFIVRIRICQGYRSWIHLKNRNRNRDRDRNNLKNRNRNRNRNNLLLWFRVMIRQIEGVNSRGAHPAGKGAGCR
jgi:hypothetical protein